MGEQPAVDLSLQSIEWAVGLLDGWIEANEGAQQIQAALPDHFRNQIEGLPPGFDFLPAAMAHTINPASVSESHVLLTSARRVLVEVLEGSLSHPGATIGPKTDAEIGARVEHEAELVQLRRRVAELEGLTERYETALRMVEAASATALSGRGERCFDDVDVRSGERAVGF